MQALGPAPAVLTPDQILAQYGSAIEECLKAAVDQNFEFERQIQINKARIQWQMVLGNHFLVPGMVQTSYGEIADYVPFDGSSSNEENGADVKLCRPVNLIGGDCQKFIAVMGNMAPRVKAVADNPENLQNLADAKNADAVLRDLWTKWRADRLQRTLAFHQYTTGPVYGRTVWVTDRLKYGQSVEPKIEVVPGPDGTPVPQQVGQQAYPNGDVELHLYTVFDVSHPYVAKNLDECGWFNCETLRNKWELLAAYPDKLAQYRLQDLPDSATASTAAANEARESVANPSRIGRTRRTDQWRFSERWLQPYMLEAIQDDEARQVLQRQYPDGMYVARVGDVKVAVENRKLKDEWTVCKTGRGEKILEDPISADGVPMQRILNDLISMAQETILRAITQTIIDSTLVDREAWSKKEAVPAEMLLTAMPVDGDLQKRVFQIPPARLSDQLMPFATAIRAWWQETTGIRPEIAGGGAPTQTYREAKQRKDQALMQLSPQSQEMGYFWECAGENGVRLRAKYGTGSVSSSREGSFGIETDTVDLASLAEDGWHCESDDNFPMSSADRFDKFWSILKEFPPEVAQALSLLDPINQERTMELLQIPGYESTVEDQKKKTLNDIQQLLQGEPIPGQPGPDGQPGPSQPSLMPDQYDDHALVADLCMKWMRSDTGQRAKQQSPAGFQNVEAFQQAHMQMAQPPQPPPPPAVRANLGLTAKLEDFPNLIPEVFQGAGLPAPQPGATVPQPPPVQAGGGPGGAPESQESPLPPPDSGPEGPQASIQ